MFKNPFQVAVTFALIALIIKLVLMNLGIQHDETPYITYSYMLLILCAIFFGIRSNKVMYEGKTTFGQDFKTGARTASFFALLVAAITFVYYSKIDPEFFPIKIAKSMDEYAKNIPDLIKEKGLEDAKEFFKNKIIALGAIYSPISQTTYTLFGLVFLGLFHSAVFALLMKKFPGFKK
tara:strand:+ start:120 stop:653 length:534 start_codon:yes stop_codon:yes gene_type:complete